MTWVKLMHDPNRFKGLPVCCNRTKYTFTRTSLSGGPSAFYEKLQMLKNVLRGNLSIISKAVPLPMSFTPSSSEKGLKGVKSNSEISSDSFLKFYSDNQKTL